MVARHACLAAPANAVKVANMKSHKPGDIFGSWTLIAWNKEKQRWLAKCSCGSEKYVQIGNLEAGRSKSCKRCSVIRKKEGSIAEQAERAGVSAATVSSRLRRGLSMEEALSKEAMPRGKGLKELADKHGINYVTFVSRIYRGWTIECALSTPIKY